MFTIHLNAAYSRLGETRLSADSERRLSRHQERTVAALKSSNAEVVFNTAMTGDGKSLAAYWRSVTERNFPTLGLYPTNELSRDQRRQVERYVEAYSANLSPTPRVERITGRILREYCAAKRDVSKQTKLLTLIRQGEVVLSNPDIYHYVFNLFYRHKNQNPDVVFQEVIKNFDLTVFDEFHIFRVPQIASVVNTLLLIRRSEGVGRKKFLFLSATPSNLMLEMFERAGVTYESVKGEYLHCDDTQPPPDPHVWRRILHGVTLHFDALRSPEGTAERWVKQHFESKILAFFHRNKGAKGAIVVNSVASAKRLTFWLRERLRPHGLTAESNTGFDGESVRRGSYEADILVGTSTIDVGVDFAINFLVFEATDAGSFIQRFGRLGRHDGNVGGGAFTEFEAYALLPYYILENLFADGEGTLRNGERYDRETFFAAVRNESVYPATQEFSRYASVWGGLQAACVYTALLCQKEVAPAYAGFIHTLGRDYQKALKTNINVACRRLQRCKRTEEGELIRDEAVSFRGTSPLQCAVVDGLESNPQERFKTYDLPMILSNWRITEVLSKEKFLHRATVAGIVDQTEFEESALYLGVGALRDERLKWRFFLNYELRFETFDLKASNGLEVSPFAGERLEDCNRINDALRKRRIIRFIVRGDPNEIRMRRRLPPMFRLYPLAERMTQHDLKSSFAIAFGQEALQLSTLFWKEEDLSDEALIC
jgi:CRISPR-associated endonuclease/helicase Cas3